ncbi:F-box protein At5g49610-like [Humulus lupulus]|uniref:F-box protein At5g49610-like n=1 Tax=Humulus lupulus TaxID=3486 RepID=UPI002B4033F6|nr:F-box protein At5g49610-like [Humulus lupulus]
MGYNGDQNCKRKKIEEDDDAGGGASTNFAIMGGINDDLLLEILIRIYDHRFAIQCSLVCKRWRGLILSPEFVRSFKGKQVSPTTLLIQMGDSMLIRKMLSDWIGPRPTNVVYQKPLSSFNSYFSFIPQQDLMTVKASFNDLLLVANSTNYYICNPFTRQWFLLPKPHNQEIIVPCRYGLSCSSSKKNKLLKYRVLLVQDMFRREPGQTFLYNVALFRSETKSWRLSTFGLSRERILKAHQSSLDKVVFCNGKFHWLIKFSLTLIITPSIPFATDVGISNSPMTFARPSLPHLNPNSSWE